MKLKNAVIYRYKSFVPLLAAMVVFSVLQYVLTANETFLLADLALVIAKCVFFFAFGIMSFKKPYKYLLQNGYKNSGIYESFILFVPSTLIVSVIISTVSYFVRAHNDYFTLIFADGNLGLAKSDMATFLIFKIISCATVFSVSLISGYIFAMILYRFNSKILNFFGCLVGAAIIAGVVLLAVYAQGNGILSAYFIPAIVMILIPLTVIFASLGYFLCTRIELERSRS